ncbi:uncharacterized protein MYCFIDRAFT_197797 [Pseudocercospora fijiensis CIRAD86]|uniref:BTB domain-containing protein n=1 Tax=Pseudocercospora fijiensis (strain CIRAD86) TaxID=383855 RepID=M2YT61_PSEFD|nr:uncharacterized protein MYCFIDRAFT_197797 [Pseudocercospora fijiensis CIRAD86]EME80930.1 hypothetical protein MYCFIDRAFT_197797 [Pseudocercospora fijiensis CIRAD86]
MAINLNCFGKSSSRLLFFSSTSTSVPNARRIQHNGISANIIDTITSTARHEAMYRSEQWSDLSIETPTRTFRVHKAVVCELNPFMKAACTRGFVESNRIQLPEDEAVVEAILQHFYEVPVYWRQQTSAGYYGAV